MPHTTFAYPFEAKVGSFAGRLSQDATAGARRRSFLLTFDSHGSPSSPNFEPPSSGWFAAKSALEATGVPHLFYDPLEDGMEYIWLSWWSIDRLVMERLLGERFEDADFVPLSEFAQRADELPR